MINAQVAREIVAATEDVAAKLADLDTKINEAAAAGMMFLEDSLEDAVLAAKVTAILADNGYEARFDSNRSMLRVKW